jgi:hypothetical protein
MTLRLPDDKVAAGGEGHLVDISARGVAPGSAHLLLVSADTAVLRDDRALQALLPGARSTLSRGPVADGTEFAVVDCGSSDVVRRLLRLPSVTPSLPDGQPVGLRGASCALGGAPSHL